MNLASKTAPVASVQVLGRDAKLDDKIARKVLRLGLAALFAPETMEGSLILAHDDPRVRTSYKVSS